MPPRVVNVVQHLHFQVFIMFYAYSFNTVFPNIFLASAPFSDKQISIAPLPCLAHISTQFSRIVYFRGGQTAAREPHAALATFACGSLSFPKNCIFVFYLLFLLQSVEIL